MDAIYWNSKKRKRKNTYVRELIVKEEREVYSPLLPYEYIYGKTFQNNNNINISIHKNITIGKRNMDKIHSCWIDKTKKVT